MKKLTAIVLALTLALTALAALADTLNPVFEVDPEMIGQTEHMDLYAATSSAEIDENLVITLSVYGADRYAQADIEALKAGDVILVYDKEMTVETITSEEGEVNINGGFFDAAGATLWLAEDGYYYAMMWDDTPSMTLLCQVTCPLAETVTVSTFAWTADGEPADDMETVELSAAEVKDYLARLESESVYFDSPTTRVELVNGQVTMLIVEWTPAA